MTISFSNARNRRGEKGKKGQETRFFFSFLTNDSFFGIKKKKILFFVNWINCYDTIFDTTSTVTILISRYKEYKDRTEGRRLIYPWQGFNEWYYKFRGMVCNCKCVCTWPRKVFEK